MEKEFTLMKMEKNERKKWSLLSNKKKISNLETTVTTAMTSTDLIEPEYPRY